MSTLSSTGVIDHVANEVDKASYKAKVSPAITEEIINEFLDQILLLKKLLKDQTSELSHLNNLVEQLTWVEGPIEEENLKKINDIVAKMKDLYSSLNRQLMSLKSIKDKGIATNQIKGFKAEVDGVRESYEDLESVFFYLPAILNSKRLRKLSL